MQCLLHSRLSTSIWLHIVVYSVSQRCPGGVWAREANAGSEHSQRALQPAWDGIPGWCPNLKANGPFWLLLGSVSAW